MTERERRGYQGPQAMQVRAFLSYEVESTLRDAILHLHALDLEGQMLTCIHQQPWDLGRESRGQESRDGSVPSRAQLWLGATPLVAEPAAKPSRPASLRDASAPERWSSLLEQLNTSRNTETLKSLYICIGTAGVGEDEKGVRASSQT